MNRHFKSGDVIKDSLNWFWVFFEHKGKLALYPLDYWNEGKLSEGGECSFIHDPSTWDLSTVKLAYSLNDK